MKNLLSATLVLGLATFLSAAPKKAPVKTDTSKVATTPPSPSPVEANKPAAPKPAVKASASAAAVSDSKIASAKAKGLVRVNLNTGVYHKDGGYYGKTKNGKFMTEDEAKKAGNRAAHDTAKPVVAAAKDTGMKSKAVAKN
jgi:outer membrane protein TolC